MRLVCVMQVLEPRRACLREEQCCRCGSRVCQGPYHSTLHICIFGCLHDILQGTAKERPIVHDEFGEGDLWHALTVARGAFHTPSRRHERTVTLTRPVCTTEKCSWLLFDGGAGVSGGSASATTAAGQTLAPEQTLLRLVICSSGRYAVHEREMSN